MPGRTPAEAVAFFLDPLRQASSVLGQCKITTSPKARSPEVGDRHTWTLNSGAGVAIASDAGSLRFEPTMYWHLIRDERDGYGPLRVSTLGYDYRLSRAEDHCELWSFHWHPGGPSPVTKPHVHLGPVLLAQSSPVTPKTHLPTGRTTYEQAIRWIVEGGGKPAHDDWENRLLLAETPHLLYRDWSQTPPG